MFFKSDDDDPHKNMCILKKAVSIVRNDCLLEGCL